MRIHTAWHESEAPGEMPWLVSAYDEYTGDAHNGTPQFHIDAIAQASADGAVVREMIIDIPEAEVMRLFEAPTVAGTVES